MADTNLRALERRAAAGDASAALELSCARARVGDAAGALEASWLACEDPALRNEVARVPIGSAAVLTAPRLLWQTTFEGRGELGRVTATPLVIMVRAVVGRRGVDFLLDPRTGASRGVLPSGDAEVHEGIIAVWNGQKRQKLIGVDAWTGETLYTVPVRGDRVGVSPETFLVHDGPHVILYRFFIDRRPPAEVWRVPVTERSTIKAFVVGDAVVLWRRGPAASEHEMIVCALSDGAVRARLDGLRPMRDDFGYIDIIDADGIVGVARLDGPALPPTPVAYGLDGVLRWRLDGGRGLTLVRRAGDRLAFGGRAYLGAEPTLFVDRRTGTACEAFPDPGPPLVQGVTVEARRRYVRALTATGEELWTWEPPAVRASCEPSTALLPGRVLVALKRTIFCLGLASEGAPAPSPATTASAPARRRAPAQPPPAARRAPPV